MCSASDVCPVACGLGHAERLLAPLSQQQEINRHQRREITRRENERANDEMGRMLLLR
jgi:hypothetical protein